MTNAEILPSKKENFMPILTQSVTKFNHLLSRTVITDNLLDCHSSRTRVLNDKRRNIAFKKRKVHAYFDAKCDKIQPSAVKNCKLLTTC
jgi:hypothetical protein